MPAVVTFDVSGPGLFIREIDTGGDNELDLVEIYSEWKDWAAQSDNLKYPPAFRQVGSDPITDIQNLGTTFFLNTGDGWQIKPAERDHLLQINGNLFTDPAGLNPIAPTDGAFTVLVRMFVSNLVDASVARLDLNQLLQGVYIDVVNGVSGTTTDVGTPTNPVNNLTDALTIATSQSLNTLIIRGNLTVDQNLTGYNLIGEDGADDTALTMAGYDFDNCNFTEMQLNGTMTGVIEADRCDIQLTSGLAGQFRDCRLSANFTVAANQDCLFHDCYSGIPGDSRVTMTFGSNSTVNFRHYSGGLEVASMGAGNTMSFDGDPGKIVAGATNTGGTLLYRGSTTTDFTGIGGVTLIDDRFSALDKTIDGATLETLISKIVAGVLGNFTASNVAGGKSFAFLTYDGNASHTLEIADGDTGNRTRTSG